MATKKVTKKATPSKKRSAAPSSEKATARDATPPRSGRRKTGRAARKTPRRSTPSEARTASRGRRAAKARKGAVAKTTLKPKPAARKPVSRTTTAKTGAQRDARTKTAANKSAPAKPAARRTVAPKPAVGARRVVPQPVARPAVRRYDRPGHLDPHYAAELRRQSGPREHEPRAFFEGPRATDDLAEERGEEVVENATTGSSDAEEMLDQMTPEEQGGPFVETSGAQEFAHDTDASNPKGAKREPFPTT